MNEKKEEPMGVSTTTLTETTETETTVPEGIKQKMHTIQGKREYKLYSNQYNYRGNFSTSPLF